ncbi:hypothetical protein EGW08_007508, partial [Elysia chlorotica]
APDVAAPVANKTSPSSGGNDTAGETGQGAPPAETPTKATEEPVAPGPTMLVPDFSLIATHEKFGIIKNMAASLGVDVAAIAAMSREEQQQAMKSMSPELADKLPLLKAFLEPDPDKYFYSIPAPSSRRRRQAEDSSMSTSGNETEELAVPETTTVARAVEPTEMSQADKMLEKLNNDLMWQGTMAGLVRTQFADLFNSPCTQKKIKEMVSALCPYNIGPLLDDRDGAAKAFVALISLGMVVAGLAKAAHPAFAAIYIDSRSTEMKSGIYFGILFGLSALGAVVSQLLGFNASTSYITLEDVGYMGFLNPRWVGAWWTGLLLVVCGSFLVGLLLFFYPNANDRLVRQAREKNFSKTAKGFLQSGMRLLGNPIFLLITLANALTVMACEGMLHYLPKYVENQFYFNPMGPGIFLGLVIPLIMAMGVFGGGIISSVAKLSPFNCLKLVAACALSVFVLQAALLGVGCDQVELNKGDRLVNTTMGETLQCSQTCVCMDFIPMPACGSDGITYLTPCHAGCGFPIEEGNSFKWHHCK